ncbi:MAG: hypothetical protein U1E76_14920 [Planctomycetota bacterium]
MPTSNCRSSEAPSCSASRSAPARIAAGASAAITIVCGQSVAGEDSNAMALIRWIMGCDLPAQLLAW